MLYLTKTDFRLYLQCPKSLWLKKHKPKVYQHYKKPSDSFLRDEYEEVKKCAQRLFQSERSQLSLFSQNHPTKVLFKKLLRTDEGISTYIDILEQNAADGTYNLYEVNVKSDKKMQKDKIKEAYFQMIALEKCELQVRDIFIIHVNPDYVRRAKLERHRLLKKVSITQAVRDCEHKTRMEIHNALALLRQNAIDETGCGCYWKTRANQCDTFEYFNKTPKQKSVWELPRIKEEKLCTLLNQGIERLVDIPNSFVSSQLNSRQSDQVRSAVKNEPIVKDKYIAKMMHTLTFPLYFLDYETISTAVPKVDGTKPWQKIPFQFSLHIFHEDGKLDHKEYLSDTMHGVEGVLHALYNSIDCVGSIISWNAPFEKLCNRTMGQLYPEYRFFLADINDRMFDLEIIFKKAYIDAEFGGSTSLKNVLPVMCPRLSYEALEVQDGRQAMEQWLVMLDSATAPDKRSRIRNALLEYCALDTYAMVELYRTLCFSIRGTS